MLKSLHTKKSQTRPRDTVLAVIAWLVLAASISVAVFAAIKLWETNEMYAQGEQYYAQLRTTVALAAGENPMEETIGSENAGIDFAALRASCPDAIAWLQCPGTPIDYPIMEASEYSRWLYRLPDSTPNANGSLFLDYHHSPDFSDRLSVIYGHNMRSGAMFGSLEGYKRQDYYDTHPQMWLTTEKERYQIDIIYGCVVDAGQWRERAFMFEANLESLLAYAAENSTFTADRAYTDSDRFLVLSTCSYEFDEARYILIGIMQQ